MNKEITSIDLVEGGNVVKQGDYFTIGYRPRNAKGEAVDLTGKAIAVEIFNKDGIAFDSTGEFDPGDGLIYVHVNKNIGYGNMFIEFTVTDPNDAGYRLKFPTNNNAGRLTIHRSTDDLEYVGVKMVTVEQLKADQRTFEQTVDGKVETLKQRVDTGIGAFTSSTEILDARGGEVNLRARLDKTTAQLADKASKTDLQGVSLAFKESYDSLALLQAAYPAGDNFNHTVKADGMIYTYKNGWVSTGIQANGTGLTNGSVDITKLDFTIGTKNLFDGNYKAGFALGVATSPYTILQDSGAQLAVIPVTGGKTYYFRQFDQSDRLRLAGTINAPNFTNGTPTDHIFGYFDAVAVPYARTITVPANMRYLLVHVSSTKLKPRIQLLETDSSEFIPYKLISNKAVEQKVVEREGLSDSVASAIMFDKFTPVFKKGELAVSTGKEGDNPTRVRSEFFEVKKGSVINSVATDTAGMYVFRYNLQREFVGATGYTNSYTMPEDGIVRIVSKYTDDRTIPDASVFNGKFVLNINREMSAIIRPYLYGNFVAYYHSKDIAGKGNIHSTESATSLYGKYDALMAANSDILTRKLLGYGGNASGVADTNLPIYEYELKPPATSTGVALNGLPKILITSGVHGNEKSSTESTFEFFKQMLDGYTENDSLASIKSNVHFKVVPILNPGGYNDNTRNNRRGVDINRNLSYRWNETVSDLKGSAPYSEVESVILRDWLLANNDAVAYIDYHNTGEMYGVSYFNTPDTLTRKVYSSLIRRLSDIWFKKYNGSRNLAQGWITNDAIPCTFNEAIYAAKIKNSAILEIAWDYNNSLYTNEVMQRGVDLLANYLLAYLDQYNKGLKIE